MCSLRIGIGAWLTWSSLVLAQEPNSIPTAQVASATALNAATDPMGGERQEGLNLATLEQALAEQTRELQAFKEQTAQADNSKDIERLQKQIDLLQRQIVLLQQMVRLVLEQSQQPKAQTTQLIGRGLQAAQRDQELAGAVDTLREQADAQQRYGPTLPATLKELFLPNETNESPLSSFNSRNSIRTSS